MDQQSEDPIQLPNPRHHPHHVGFEAAEHAFIGNLLNLTFPGGIVPGIKFDFHIKNQLISLGDIVALAGDFYGNWKVIGDAEQISDKWSTDPAASVRRFEENATTLATDSPGYLEKVLTIMKEERAIIAAAVAAGKDPAQEYAKIADTFNVRYTIATRWGIYSAYLFISLCNWDHFGQDAIYAYTAGHTAALAQAKKAHESGIEGDLRYAYFLEGFALHFLTDLFSSGHLRPPRRILHATLSKTPENRDGEEGYPNPWPADGCAKEFHDEDCANGLFVTNHLGDSWPMYGDGQLFSTKSVGNLSRAVQASQIGLDEVWKVFTTGDNKAEGLFTALSWVADLDKLAYPIEFAPLFKYDSSSKTLYTRTKIEERANPSVRVIQQNFLSFRQTLAEIEGSGTHKNRLPLTMNFPTTIPIIQLQYIDGENPKYMSNSYGPVTTTDFTVSPPGNRTSWNMRSRGTPSFEPSAFLWKSSEYLSPDIILSVSGKNDNEIPQKTEFAAYQLDFSQNSSAPISKLWQLASTPPADTPDAAVPGKLSTGSDIVAFVPSPAANTGELYIFRAGITEKPEDITSFITEESGRMIRGPITVDGSIPSQLLAVTAAGDNFVQWRFYGWTEDYTGESFSRAIEQTGPIISEQWWRYLTGSLLLSDRTTQVVRLLYGDHADPGILQIDVSDIKGSPPEVKQLWTKKYNTASWGNPPENHYLKFLLLDVSHNGNLDIVALLNIDDSTLRTVVFPSLGDYSFGEPVVSTISIPESLFNPAFFRSVLVAPAEFQYPETQGNLKVNTGILQFFDNYQILGARLLAPTSPTSLNYELKGQTPAIAGQTTVGAGLGGMNWNLDDWPGFLASKV